ncbi:hypothetical protein MLD38_000428 [Melastoma candidum]|uniref:Uncharacterized protein n=1 Tax=Melastoma candidum TaxID=119954 RepID=A0ACB9SBL9_9MYRT|nr:hypothetical protein MLD38_000428 [Melastoma candidum]
MPRFFFRSSDKPMNPSPTPSPTSSSTRRGRRPKLDRRNAVKHFDYDASTSSSSSSARASALDDSLHTRSLDVDQTSFRVEGAEGEIESILKNLGLSGIDDFSIPADAWEARRIRSVVSDVLPPSRLTWTGSFKEEEEGGQKGNDKEKENDDDDDDDGGEREREKEVVVGDGFVGARILTELTPGWGGMRAEDSSARATRRVGDELSGGVFNGIRGIRPAMLQPPPSMRLPVIDDTCSTWDLLRYFAPVESEGLGSSRESRFGPSSDEEEEEEVVTGRKAESAMGRREQDRGIRVGETVVLSTSCSFSTSNDDDSSSSTSNISPNMRVRRTISCWDKGQLLGRGSFGSVYEGIADDGFFFAVKEVSLHEQGARESILQLEQEIALLSQFEHENIVQYYGTERDENNLYIFLELVTKGSLLNLYHTYNLRDSQVSSYTRQILNGLKYLHDRNVVHRDIKCANILVDASGSVKLADFGLAKATRLNDVKSCKGTVFWMAPEVVKAKNNHGYGLPADIWSLGCTVLEMLTQQLPYYPLELAQAMYRIGRGESPPVQDTLSPDARDFILRCVQVNPDDRPTAARLLEHPFVKRPPPAPSGSSSPYPGYLVRRYTS